MNTHNYFSGTRFVRKTRLAFSVSTLLSFAIPLSALAASTGTYCAGNPTSARLGNLGDVFKFGTCLIIQYIVPLAFMIAIAIFVWGAVKFIGSTQSTEREQGQQFMLWGVVGFAVMFSIWGLVHLLGNTFSVENVTPEISRPGTIQP